LQTKIRQFSVRVKVIHCLDGREGQFDLGISTFVYHLFGIVPMNSKGEEALKAK